MFATVQSFTDLKNAIATLNGSYGTIELDPASYSVASNYIIPANISLLVNHGAIFVVGSGATLTIDAEIKAGRYQIFDGAGAIFGSPKVEHIYPEWFHVGGTSWSYALNSALRLANGSTPVSLGRDVYHIHQPINLIEGSVLVGSSARASIIKKGTNSDLNMLFVASHVSIRDVTVDGDRGNRLGTSAGVLIHGFSNAPIHSCELRRVIVKNQDGQGISLVQARENSITDVTVSGNSQRGINVSQFSHNNVISNVRGFDNEKSDIIIGHGSHNNIVSDGVFHGTRNTNVWLSQDSHDNTLSNLKIHSPLPGYETSGYATYAIVLWNAYKNHITNVHIKGFKVGILLRSDSVNFHNHANLPLWDDDTRDNVISNCNIDGDGTGSIDSRAIHFHARFEDRGTKRIVYNIVSNVTIDNFYDGVVASSDHGAAEDIEGNIFLNIVVHNIVRYGLHFGIHLGNNSFK